MIPEQAHAGLGRGWVKHKQRRGIRNATDSVPKSPQITFHLSWRHGDTGWQILTVWQTGDLELEMNAGRRAAYYTKHGDISQIKILIPLLSVLLLFPERVYSFHTVRCNI